MRSHNCYVRLTAMILSPYPILCGLALSLVYYSLLASFASSTLVNLLLLLAASDSSSPIFSLCRIIQLKIPLLSFQLGLKRERIIYQYTI